MKELKYNGNLKEDIKCFRKIIEEKGINIKKFIILTSITDLVIFASFLLYCNSFSYSLLCWLLCFGVSDVSLKLLLNSNSVKRDNEINNRLNDLVLELNNNNVEIELEELGKAIILEQDNYDKLFNQKECIKYFSILDKKEQIKVLKMVKYELLNYERFNSEDYFNNEDFNLFLLEDEDINLLDNSLKRVLKRDK